MKTVFVTLRGRGPVYWMECLNDGVTVDEVDANKCIFDLEEEELLDNDLNEVAMIVEDVEVLYTENEEPVWNIDDEGAVDITKKKGKYLLVNNFFSKCRRLIAPFYVDQVNYCEQVNSFEIKLEDDEEFDPKKLQLIKSDYELQFLPFGIVSNGVVYNDKVVWADPEDGYDDKYSQRFIYNEAQPYASSAKAVKYHWKTM